ncbi:MAG: ribonuclease R [Planctomycetaceae bacterium]|nr:ribonuclease R [Planctomycetaceae bacterium]
MSKIENQIIEFLSEPGYRPIDSGTLSKKLGITKRNMKTFRSTIGTLVDQGRIREGKKGRLRLKTAAGFVSGTVKKIASGAAFVIPTEKVAGLDNPDVYVSARDIKDAQTGDEVLVRLISRRRSGGQRCGQVEKILERARNVFVGTYLEAHGQGFVRVDGTTFNSDIHVGDPGAKGAMPDDKVVIEMLRFPSANRVGEAVLTEVLGHRGDPGVDTMTVVHSLGVPHDFSEDVLDDARRQAELFDESDFGDRLDLTKETIVTIDPATARDFDDAISLRRDKRGHWQLGVHIADVAHFVPVGGALDRSAVERGTSVYLPRHVIPMLPEVISNGLASLQEGKVRYTKSCFIEFDENGAVVGSEVANSVIKVTRRFAYEQVMPIVNDPQSVKGKVSAKVVQLLLKMHKLAMMLRKRRFKNGALQMGVPEVEIDFDDDGNVTGAHERHHDESHEIIEEFMLAANIAVAETLTARDIPFLRRVHGTPDELRLKSFQDFVSGLGYDLERYQSRAEIQTLINDVAGKPEERAINFALLRTMKQAEYSPEEFAHFALNEEHYCHFTSPIRRYPDLLVHRLIGDLAAGKKPKTGSMNELLQLGKNCSTTERRAEKAERELKRIKLLRYLEDRVGDELDAFITGVESFGIFCQASEVPAEGLVHISSLTDDFYSYHAPSKSLTGERTGGEYRLGDQIRVVIVNVDVDRRQLDFRVVGKPAPRSDAGKSGKHKSRSSKRGKSGATSSGKPGRGKGKAKGKSRGKSSADSSARTSGRTTARSGGKGAAKSGRKSKSSKRGRSK